MSSRLHRLGNIYTRMSGLISKGHIKEEDKPLWMDVYKHFPPKYEPTYKRVPPEVKMRQIFYTEDVLRAKIQKALPARMDLFDLKGNKESLSQDLLKTCQKYVSEGLTEDEAIKKAMESRKEQPEVTEKSVPKKAMESRKEQPGVTEKSVQRGLDRIFA